MNGNALLGLVLWLALGLATVGYSATKHEQLRVEMEKDTIVMVVAILAWPLLIGAEIAKESRE